MPALEELRNNIRHMREPELLAFERQHRANPDSVEYLEAQAAWLRRINNAKYISDALCQALSYWRLSDP
jgi:hypothetical protein